MIENMSFFVIMSSNILIKRLHFTITEHFSDMSLVLRFPPRLQNQALKCLAVAKICQTKLEEHKGENYPKLSLLLGQDVEIFGSGAICKYFLDQDSSQDVVFQSVTLQWISFVDSELR